MNDSVWAEYNNTGGFVARPASIGRAYLEMADGSLGARQRQLLEALNAVGASGATWRELAEWLAQRNVILHHGQISGALANLHKAGMVAMLRIQRNRCHPYIHANYRDRYSMEERFDEPAKTRSTERKELLEQLLGVCRSLISDEFHWDKYQDMIDVVVMLNEHDGLSEG